MSSRKSFKFVHFVNFGFLFAAMFKQLTLIVAILSFIVSCKSSINGDKLYGKWKYTKVEHPDDPSDTLRSTELTNLSPSIQFTKSNDLVIVWGGKVLSHGKYNIDGYNIRFKESLPDGTTRQFPFWVIKITNNELIFETTGEGKTRVTAVR